MKQTIDLSVDLLFKDKPNIDAFTKTDFHELITFALSESLVSFNNEYYKLIDGVAMDSPLGSPFANTFLSLNKFGSKITLVDLNLSFMKDMLMTPSYYFDQKIILKNFDITLFANILILILHLRGKKTILYRFLILKFKRVNHSFSANIYRKVTFSRVFTNFQCFFPISSKSNLIFTLLFRAFKIKIESVCPSVLPFFCLSVQPFSLNCTFNFF